MYEPAELQAQYDGLMLRISRLSFLRDHTADTRKIDVEIRRDELQARALRLAMTTRTKEQN